jgi:HEPN domain-containing protein
MGLDIKLKAFLPVRGIDLSGKEVISELSDRFDCLSIPSKDVECILNSDDITSSYKKYVMDNYNEDYLEEVYDVFGEYVIDHKFYNIAKNHLKELDEFLNENKYWHIKWYGS